MLRSHARAVFALSLALSTAPAALALGTGRTDFVDCGAAAGGDGSWAKPWGTLEEASAVPLGPGSRLLLRRGTTCVGTLAPAGSGAAGDPAYVGAYGSGAAPRVLGGGEDAVRLRNTSHVVLQDLELENRGDFETTRRRGVHLVADGAVMSDVTVRRLYIHDVEGDLAKDSGGSGGIQVDGVGGGRFDGLVIEHNRIEDVSRSGIFLDTSSGARPRSGEPWPGASTGIVIRQNRLLRLAGDGIVPVGALGAVIEDNVVGEGNLRGSAAVPPFAPICNAGIWAFHSNDTVIQRNEVYGMAFNGCDGTGYDIDYNQDGTIVQYNYSHDNEGGFILLCTDSEPRSAEVRFNLSVDDGWAILTAPCAFPSLGDYDEVRMFNNTIVGPHPLAHFEGVEVPFLVERRTLEFRNNVIVATEPQTSTLPCSTTRCSHNLYYGLPPSGTDAITAEPIFLDPTRRGFGRLLVGKGFALQAGSPGVGAGIPMPGSPDRDYFDRLFDPTAPPTLGMHQR